MVEQRAVAMVVLAPIVDEYDTIGGRHRCLPMSPGLRCRTVEAQTLDSLVALALVACPRVQRVQGIHKACGLDGLRACSGFPRPLGRSPLITISLLAPLAQDVWEGQQETAQKVGA